MGNNQVEVTAVGFAGEALFSESAMPSIPAGIVMDNGNNQKGVVGQRLPNPFVAVVIDSGNNRLAGVPATFTVTQGGGNFNGQTSVTLNTNSDGRVQAVLTLGPDEGFDNNLAQATFPGNSGFPVSFVASGKVAGNPANTKISGVVLDNSDIPTVLRCGLTGQLLLP